MEHSNRSASINHSAPTATPTPTPIPSVCEPVTGLDAYRMYSTIVYASWTNPTTGLSPTGKKVYIEKWDGSAWVFERIIN